MKISSFDIRVHLTLFNSFRPNETKPSLGLDDGLSPVRRHAIDWTNIGLLSRTKFSEISL